MGESAPVASAWRGLKTYALDYVSGVVWLVALSLALDVPSDFLSRSPFKELLNNSTNGASFALVVAGLVVPYCLDVVMAPISILAMNWVLRLERRFPSLGLPVHGKRLDKLNRIAAAEVRKVFPYDIEVTRPLKVTLLRLHNPYIANWVARGREGIDLRVSTAAPASVLIGSIVWKSGLSVNSGIVAVFLGVLLFLVAAQAINRDHRSQLTLLNIALLATLKEPVGSDRKEPVVEGREPVGEGAEDG
jgi:hypothetical protein